jgi:hypothetical protein
MDVWDEFGLQEAEEKEAQRVQKRKERVEEQKQTRGNKKWARDCFNEPLDKSQQADMLAKLNTSSFQHAHQRETWVRLYHTLSTKDIAYQFVKAPEQINPLECIFVFVEVADHCAQYTARALAQLGWREDLTDYDPVVVSNSVEELLEATIEHHRMAIKLALRVTCDAQQQLFPIHEIQRQDSHKKPRKKKDLD